MRYFICLVTVVLAFGYGFTEYETIIMPDSICEAKVYDVGEHTVFAVRFMDYMLLTDSEGYMENLPIGWDEELKLASSDAGLFAVYSATHDSTDTTTDLVTRSLYPELAEAESRTVPFLVSQWLPFFNGVREEFDVLVTEARDSIWLVDNYDVEEGRTDFEIFTLGRSRLMLLNTRDTLGSFCLKNPVLQQTQGYNISFIVNDYSKHYEEWEEDIGYIYVTTMNQNFIVFSIDLRDMNVQIVDTVAHKGFSYWDEYRYAYYCGFVKNLKFGINRHTQDILTLYSYYTFYNRADPDSLEYAFAGSLWIEIQDTCIVCPAIPPFFMLGNFFTNTVEHGRRGLIAGDRYFFPPLYTPQYFDDYDSTLDKLRDYHDLGRDDIDEVFGWWGDTLRFYRLFEGSAVTEHELPGQLEVSVYPNPFNAACQINVPDGFTANIYDIHGRQVHTMPPGINVWNANDQPSGVYLVRAQRGEQVVEKRVVLVK